MVELKGFAAPVPMHRILGASAAQSRLDAEGFDTADLQEAKALLEELA